MRVYSVSDIASYLKELLESDAHLSDVWVSGEVSNLTRSTAGHLYFTLKDAEAQLRCVFFRGGTLQGNLASLLESGAQVAAHGRISMYEVRGDLQFYVDFIQPEGIGLLAMEFERLKARLQREGLFDDSRKRPLPAFPSRIGVVTSPTGAVFHDICSILSRRWPLAELVLAPAAVQGFDAAAGVCGGIAALNREPGVEVIIVARGGGSMEELWAFNDEAVARAIYASHVPVVSAVGHETDFTIADFVADVRAPTPSAAAELVAPDRRQVAIRTAILTASLTASLSEKVGEGQGCVRDALGRMQHCSPSVDRERQRVDDLLRAATSVVDLSVRAGRERVDGFLGRLRSLHPQATLERGYAIVERDGTTVRSAKDVRAGDLLGVRVHDGSFPARVEPSRRRKRPAKPGVQAPLFPEER